MARPISWLPRLHAIRKAVAGSIRSHYTRQDLERLFDLGPRAAGKLLADLRTGGLGVNDFVEREALVAYLDRIHAAEDASAAVRQAREEKTPAPRKIRLRSLVQRDDAPVALEGIPESITLERGRLEVCCGTVAELAEAMYWVARILAEDGERLAQMFEVGSLAPATEEEDEVGRMFAELE